MFKIPLLFTAPLCLLTQLCFSEPGLVIPLGSYMETALLWRLYISDNKLHYFDTSIDLDCWQAGHDIYFDHVQSLNCDTSETGDVVNAARFLYSTLIPAGKYLETCTGLLKMPVNVNGTTRYYLYASCRAWSIHKPPSWAQKVDITDCPAGQLVNRKGDLVCPDFFRPRRKIVSGSYLTSGCDVAESYYNASVDKISTRCEGIDYSISNITSAINSGKDVVYRNQSLEFANTSQGPASIHEASLYLPPGNYTLSCRNAAFFPCMGQAGQGLLVAKCLPAEAYGKRDYKSAFLEDADDHCAMHNMGYVSNIDGNLVCDPDIEFNYEENPTEAGLLEHLQCPTSK